MSDHDPNRTVPRVSPAKQPSDDTKPRAANGSAADPNRTADHSPAGTPASAGTVARTPSDVARLEEGAKARAAEGVPGYVLLRELGRGGMGVVYEARHVKLNRVVALKMMLGGEQASRSGLIRFLAEAEAIAAVKHENVVQVYDYGESEGRPFMALEFCCGGTLTKRLQGEHVESPLSPSGALKLLTQVARGVAAAHARGIVHRDLKPGNVFLDESGVPKVADFGLAKRGEGADVTQEGQGMGTPAYMAPEQARDAKFVGPQADVWALGVMLYEALTGTRPFTGTVQEIMARAQNVAPVAPHELVPSVPRDLELICLHCLSKAPHERYPTAKELADDLDRYARNEPISVRPAGPLERAVKWVKRNKVVSASAAAVFLALAIGAGASLGFGLDARDQATDAKQKKKEAEEATAREAKEKLAAIDARNETKRISDEQKRTLAEALFAPFSASDCSEPLTALEVQSLWRIVGLRRDVTTFLVIEEATRTPLTLKQLECRTEFVLHAAVGLDAERRDATDRLLLTHLRREPRSARGGRLVQVSLQWDGASGPLAVASAAVLVAALDRSPSPAARSDLMASLSAAAARMDPVAGKPTLLAALDKETEPAARSRLAERLSAMAPHLDAGEARKVAAALNGALREGHMSSTTMVGCLLELVPRMDQIGAADAWHDATGSLARYLVPPASESVRERTAESLTKIAPHLAAEHAGSVAGTLVLAMRRNKYERNVRIKLAECLAALARRMNPAKVADLAQTFLAAQGHEEPIDDSEEMAEGLEAIANSLSPADATGLRPTLTKILSSALDEKRHYSQICAWAECLSAVATRMTPADAGLVLARADDAVVAVLGRETDPVARERIVKALSKVAARTDPAAAANTARVLIAALRKAPASLARSDLAERLVAYAPRLPPTAAATASASLVALLEKETDTYTTTALAECLSKVIEHSDPAATAADAKILTSVLGATTVWSRPHLASCLRQIAHRMDAVTAANTAAVLISLLSQEDNAKARNALAACFSQVAARAKPGADAEQKWADVARSLIAAVDSVLFPEEWVESLSAVIARINPTDAQTIVDDITKMIEQEERRRDYSPRRPVLLKLLAAVTGRLNADRAKPLLLNALRGAQSDSELVVLAKALVEVAARLPSDEATDTLLATFVESKSNLTREIVLAGLWEVAHGVPSGTRVRSRRATILAIGSFALPHNILPSLTPLHLPSKPLPPQDLVELLKHPFCVGGARRAVLDALEFTYKRPFKDQWEFVEYVQANNVHDHTTGKPLDLLTPPKRPEQKP